MISAQASKEVMLFLPQSVATNGTATGTVSLAGWDYAEVLLQLSTAVASNVDVVVTLTEGDVSTYATHADLAMTTVAPNTSAGSMYKWFVDCRPRKKNLKITYTPNGNVARVAAATCRLTRGIKAPVSATEHGVSGQVVA